MAPRDTLFSILYSIRAGRASIESECDPAPGGGGGLQRHALYVFGEKSQIKGIKVVARIVRWCMHLAEFLIFTIHFTVLPPFTQYPNCTNPFCTTPYAPTCCTRYGPRQKKTVQVMSARMCSQTCMCACLCACMCSKTCMSAHMAAHMCSQICMYNKKKKKGSTTLLKSCTTDTILPDLGITE